MTRAFVDSNVLIYAFDSAEPDRRQVAVRILGDADYELVISAQVLSEFYVNVTRRLQQPLEPAEAEAAIRRLAVLPVVPIDSELVLAALEITNQASISYWDALIVAAARSAGCVRLLTEDLNDGQEIAGVRIENPFRPGP